MSKKIGRNDPCWCGSGLKYKRCHLNRAQEKPVQEYEIRNELRKIFSQKYCLHPDASPRCGTIVKAHTIQRKGGLNRIARNGHVYTFLLGSDLAKDRDAIAQPELIGINAASTFTGFCNFHDNKTFEPIEKYTFESNQHHTFLFAYRAICREVYENASAPEMISPFRNLDKGRSISEQIDIKETLDAWKASLDSSFKEIQHYKTAYDRALQRSDFSEVRYYVVRFDCIPDLLCSGAMYPQYDFQGTLLQDLRTFGTLPDHISFSLIPTDNGGAAVFSWLGENRTSEKLVKSLSLLSDELLPHAIVRFTFEYFENIFASPDWWDGLTESSKQALLLRQTSGMVLRWRERPSDCLCDDGQRIVSWKVIAHETNIAF
jgi:hypothetical protein